MRRRRRQGHDVLVIGAGIAGLSCAEHAAALGLSVICFEQSDMLGGAVANVGALEGFPSARPVAGIDLANGLAQSCRSLGVDIVTAPVEALGLDGPTKSVSAGGQNYPGARVVVATGTRLRRLGVPGEEELAGRGVSQCAFCDAGLFREEAVAVVGGGDAAVQEALHLAQFAGSVTMLVRGTTLRARRSYVQQASGNPKFAFRWNTRVEAVLGDTQVAGVRIAGDDGSEELACAGLFVFIGGEPNTDTLPADIERDAEGYLLTDAQLQTSVPGVYAIGAARAGYGGELVQAAAEGVAAAQAVVMADRTA